MVNRKFIFMIFKINLDAETYRLMVKKDMTVSSIEHSRCVHTK